ncbi:MAG: hypothetical protein IKP88_11010 [Lachnospiraceae bacterium]|nr:hypothetical protein [Lachnospiraceae bacterium]
MQMAEKKVLMNKYLLIVTNILLVIFTAIGLWLMFSRRSAASPSEFLAKGFRNFKYFTTLSNVFCGLTAFSYLLALLFTKNLRIWKILNTVKIMSSSAVGVTFIVVLAFLGPMYGFNRTYRSSNLWFHLLIPVFAMIEFCFIKFEYPFNKTFYAGIPVAIYGITYLLNNIINGTGTYLDTNDFYGFLRWGYPIGILAFIVILLLGWGIACLLRFIRKLSLNNQSL